MGCICSKGEMQDLNPSIFFVTHACRFDDWPSYFAVTNMDTEYHIIKSGRLEVTGTDIIFHQGNSSPINWPLRYLRRYGWDLELFSFESGRRAPTGTGIYAFKCSRAQEVFNLLQVRFAAEESLANGLQDGSLLMPRRHTSTVDGYLEPIAPRLVPRFRTASSSPNGGARVRLDSVDSCSETQSPTPSTSTPTTVIEKSVVRSESGLSSGMKQPWDPLEPRSEERNNNGPEYSNGVVTSSGLRLATLDANRLVETDNNHVYMNVSPGAETNLLLMNQLLPAQCFKPSFSNFVIREENGEQQHSYANLELPEREEVVVPNGGSGVNYAVLDLEAGNGVTSPSSPTTTGAAPAPATLTPPDSPDGQAAPPTGYVTIDFKKTNALSHSTGTVYDKEATRKTRHNSTLPPD